MHAVLLEEVARAFTDRDVGLTTASESQEELLIYLTNHVGSDPASDSDNSDVGLGMGLYMLSQVSRLQRTSQEDYEQELEERMANFGFTEGDVEELMCQGIMPWDDCASAAIAVLHGGYY
ncbi:uncharacterized protein LOC135472593 [Liolophura sinensis]|uniref:uncharacterized protein LOC135472593 n=1 Tax=Liolophura sinensis TaxID=3198878 RepID=UPI0031598846